MNWFSLVPIRHREVRAGDERAWWMQVNIDPVKVAHELWSKTRLDGGSLRSAFKTEPVGSGAASGTDSAIGHVLA